MAIINRIAEFEAEMIEWRQDFHRHPELGLEEHRTSALVQDRLRAFGVDEIITGMAVTGVVGVIKGAAQGGAPGAAIGLRADMDALPIEEDTGLPHASTTPGVMHACGHDGHTAMLLGAAKYLAETRNFAGTVYVIFQPAEEGRGGATAMVREGLFERCPMDMVFGLHNMPSVPEGQFRWGAGPVMAGGAIIEITVTGKGGHGAHPSATIDPIVISAQIISALQTVVSRGLEGVEAGVVSIGAINAGHAHNVIPHSARMLGTARWFDAAVADRIEAGVRAVCTGIAATFGATAEVVFDRICIPTVNDPAATALTVTAAQAVAGAARVSELARPTMGGEDFAFMLERKQGSYIMLGTGRTEADPMVHHPKYDFNDAVLTTGASYWATLAEQLLPRAGDEL